MQFSTIITNHNYGRYLRQAIDSCLVQKDSGQVIVVDDGSSDDSQNILAEYRGRIEVVLHPQALGQGPALRDGMQRATGDWIAFLDADDYFLPEKFARLRATLAAHPTTQWVFHPLLRVDASGIPLAGHAIGPAPDLGRNAVAAHLRHGRLPYLDTSTSGLSFSKNLAQSFFPLPDLKHKSFHDNYFKFISVGLHEGRWVAEPLSHMRIHGANDYSGKNDRHRGFDAKRGYPKLYIAEACAKRDPALLMLATSLYVSGCADIGWSCRTWHTDHPHAAEFPHLRTLRSPALYGRFLVNWLRRCLGR